jgi:hypothetical protein
MNTLPAFEPPFALPALALPASPPELPPLLSPANGALPAADAPAPPV